MGLVMMLQYNQIRIIAIIQAKILKEQNVSARSVMGGSIEKNDNASANFGIGRPKQRCNECGKLYDPNVFNHYHVNCRHCGGTGFAR